MSTEIIINIILLVINVLFMLFNCFILGFVINKANSIPKERDIVKQLLESKVPIALPPGLNPAGMFPDPSGQQSIPTDPVKAVGKKGSYFG